MPFSDGNTVSLASLGYAYALSGQRSEALKVLSRLEELEERRYGSPAFIGYIHGGLDETDLAFERLEYDPRFQDLMRRMNLEP